jgi:chemotaxis protein histidine kinase CheA
MTNANQKQSIFAVVGMHRSGTSFTASLLQSSGVDVGERLMGPNFGNLKGHFEDLDFVELHQNMLASQGVNVSGWVAQGDVAVDPQFTEKAKELIAKHQHHALWGWKDPRTTLFLDFWGSVLPEANFLFVYRSPWEVADSLYRRSVRSQEMFLEYPDFAVKVWMHYNQKILDFLGRFPDRCLLVSVYNVANRTNAFIDILNQKFQVKLSAPTDNPYDESLLNTEVSSTYRPNLVGHYFPEALEIYQELNAKEVQLGSKPDDSSWLARIRNTPYRAWAFQDWVNLRKFEYNQKEQRSEIERLQSQLQQTEAHLAQTQSQYQQTQTELTQVQTLLQQTQPELAQANMQLQQVQSELEQTQNQLHQMQSQCQHFREEVTQLQLHLQQVKEELMQSQMQAEQTSMKLAQTEATLNWIETSKFWQLRSRFLKIKKMVFGN